ncbi:proliferation marker protein Ki-67 isoform X2 [Eublepharis macularius]|uniref:Proliferation marker protein Ki-67 isoform X2 n=1 Tax=Eublepharis macularius TaxID=481883 RepID=A0AA97L437_EUBMA|nr:proliferation marker protein Ki-67 isoform X2 [Eublepharis macularius]
MPHFGKIVVIKRNGSDGTHFPLTVNSCTFGRRKECDIRIQLPLVSKEHCKIEVNENKEAILINLSTVNPTQLNGRDFQQPVYLKHGDVLTIIDRSFRFEYPPPPPATKRISRSEEKETLQVLQVQQIEQEKLHPQNSDYKSLHISDEKLEWEGQKASGSDEQRGQEDTTRQNGPNESTYKIHRSGRKNMASFSSLYEFMKHEVDTKPTEDHFSSKIAIQEKVEYLPQNDSICIAASNSQYRISPSDQTVQTEDFEKVAVENVELPTDTENQGINMMISNPMFVEENSARVLQTYAAKDRQGCEETNLLNFQNVGENEVENSEVLKSTDEANKQSSEHLSASCCIVALEYKNKASHPKRSISPSIETANAEVNTNLRNTFGSVESVLPRPKIEGESVETCSFPCLRQASGILQTDLDTSLRLKSTAEISSETEGIMLVTTGSDVLMENKYLKTNKRNMLVNTELSLDAQILEETKMESDALKDGHFETVACLVNHSNSKSPRRSARQRRDFSSVGSFTEKIIMEESLVTARDVSPLKGVPEENMKCWPQENDGNIEERLTPKSFEDNFVMKSTAGSSYLPESPVQMPDEEHNISEMNVSSQCSKNKESVQKSHQKRKGGELDLSVQPLGKRKRVSFGGHLSPELFDKRLPPNSPLKRGAIPARFSLPFGISPRAVLKKASGFSQFKIKNFSGKDQQNNTLLKTEPPVASPPARRSLMASSPAASPRIRGRFSISRVNVPSEHVPSSEEQTALTEQMDVNKEINTPEPSVQESQTVQSVRRSRTFVPKRSSLCRRSGAVDALRVKRQSGASEANLIVSRSWAEVVKQGVLKSHPKTTSKHDFKGRPAKKMPTKASKNNVSSLKTPTRRIKGYFPTGHANSPAPIVVGKAHTSTVNITAQVPKVMFNYTLKQQDTNESFTGMTELFHTPLNWKHGRSLSSAQKSTMVAPEEASEIHTPEESGMMAVSPSDLSVLEIYDDQDVESLILRKVSQISTPGQDKIKIPRGENSALYEIVGGNSSLIKSETVEMEKVSKDTKPVKALSGVKRLMKTPKQKPQPVEALSGVKRLMKTPKQKSQPVEALSGVKRLMKTPKQKPQPVEALSGVKRLMKTPKQKPQPVDALSGVKRLMKTPKQKPQPVEALSGVKRLMKTPKQKSQPVEALSGVKRLMKTPKQKPQPVEALSGVKRLMKTPKQKPQPVEALSGVKRLMKTPKRQVDTVEEDICSKHLNSPKELLGFNHVAEAPKKKIRVLADKEGIQRLRISKQKFEPMEDMIGISRILKTPRQKFMPVDDYLGLQKLMAEPKQNSLSAEIDYTGVQELLGPEDGCLVQLTEYVDESRENSSSGFGYRGDVPKREQPQQVIGLEGSFERKSPTLMPRRPDDDHDELEDYLEQVSCSSHNRLTGADLASIVTASYVPKKYESDGMDLQNEAMIDLIKEPSTRQGASMEINEPLASAKKPRQMNVSKSSFTEEHDKSWTQRQTRNSNRGKLANCTQTNENFDQVTEINPTKDSESSPLVLETETTETLRGNSRKYLIETNGNMDFSDIRHTQELLGLSKEMSVNAEENAATHEQANQLISKMSLRPKNQKNKDEPKSELTKINSQEKMQSPDIETSTRKSGNQLLKKNSRMATPVETKLETINTSLDGERDTSHKTCKMENLGNHPSEMKEGTIRGKGRKVHFQKVPLDNTGASVEHMLPKRQMVARGNLPQRGRNKRKGCDEQPIENKNIEISDTENQDMVVENTFSAKENQLKKGRGRKVTPISLTIHKEDPSTGCLDFTQRKSLQDTLNEENSKKAQKEVPLNNTEVSAEHVLPKRQKVARGNLPRRGRSKQVGSDEQPTANESKETPVVENQDMVVENTFSAKENQPKRGRGRKAASVSQTLGSLSVPDEDPSTASSGFAQGKSLQDTLNEENSKKAQKEVPLNNTEVSAEHVLPKRQKVARGNLPRRGRSKQVGSDEQPTANESKETPVVENQDMVVENTFSAKENQPKRGRGRKAASVSQTLGSLSVPDEDPSTASSGFAQGKCLQDTPKEENSKEAQKEVPLNNSEVSAEHMLPKRQKMVRGNLPRRGRSKQVGSDEQPTANESKETPVVENQDMVVENTFSAKENQPKRGRGRKAASVSQTLGSLSVPDEDPSTASSGFAQGKCLQDTPKEENSKEAQKEVPLNNIEVSAEHMLPKRQKMVRGNLPRRGRSKQVGSDEQPTANESKETPVVENQDMVVENTFSAKENQPQRGRGRKAASVSQTLGSLSVPDEDPSTASSGFAQGKCLQDTPKEENSKEAQKEVPLNNTEVSAEHMLPKRQKIVRGNLPRRGRSKQVGSDEQPTANESKETPVVENQDMVVENTFSAKENQPKRGRGRKAASVSQTLGSLSVPEEDPSTASSGFAQGKCLQDTPKEENSKEAQKEVPLNNTEVFAEHVLPKRQNLARGNLPRRGRSKQVGSDEQPTANESKETPVVENQDMVVENTFSAKENQPKRGRGRKAASVSQTLGSLSVPDEDPSTASSGFTQGKCLQDTPKEENSKEAQKEVPLNNSEVSAEHMLPKRQKMVRGNLPRRGRSKQVGSDEQPTANESKETPVVENQDMVVENTVKENQPKRGRGKQVTFIIPNLFPSIGNDNVLLSNKDKSAAEEQNTLEMATTANENLLSRGRSRKRVNTLSASSIPGSKKPRVVNNANLEEMATVLKHVTKEHVSKTSRKKPPAYEALIESKSPRSDTGNKPTAIKDKKVPADSLFENQAKSSRGKKIILALQTPSSPSLKISITLPSSDKNKTAIENQNLFIENNGKENLAIRSRRNKKMVSHSTCVRRKCKPHEEEDECQEKQNANSERIGLSNNKQSRRGMRKGDNSETTFFKEKCGVPESSDAFSKSQQVMLTNTVSGMADASQGRRKRIHNGKNFLKHSDQKNDLEITLSQGKENSSKQGRRKRVSSEPEIQVTTAGMKNCFFAENTSVPETENTGSTPQRGRRKKIKECASATTESTIETKGMAKASRRTRKQIL